MLMAQFLKIMFIQRLWSSYPSTPLNKWGHSFSDLFPLIFPSVFLLASIPLLINFIFKLDKIIKSAKSTTSRSIILFYPSSPNVVLVKGISTNWMENVWNRVQKDIGLLMENVRRSSVDLGIIGMKRGRSVWNVNQVQKIENANMPVDMDSFWKIKNVSQFVQCLLKFIMKTNAYAWVECTESTVSVTIVRKAPDTITIVSLVNPFAPIFPITISSIKGVCASMATIGWRDVARHAQLDTSTMKDGDNASNPVGNTNTLMDSNATVWMGITWSKVNAEDANTIKYTILWPWCVDLDAKPMSSWKEMNVFVNGIGSESMASVSPNAENSSISMD